MGKYFIISKFLINSSMHQLTLTFSQIEKITHFPLPRSAHLYSPWWSNDSTHVQASDGWLNVGWCVKSVNLTSKQITFRRKNNSNILLTKDKKLFPNNITNYLDFKRYARQKLSDYYQVDLNPGQIKRIPKLFDYVSENYEIIGDAKYYSIPKRKKTPSVNYTTITEHVWLLQKIQAKKKFLVFGNDKRVPEGWLKKYGGLASDIHFYFIDEKGGIEEMK